MGDAADIAGRLHAARASGDHSPDWLVGTLDLDTALDVQLHLLDRRIAAGARLGGWKVGLTSVRARTALGVDARPFGYLLAERILDSGATVDSAAIRKPTVEPEMCFTIGTLLDRPDPRRSDVLGAISRVSAGFEINEARTGSARADFGTMVTDCLTNWGIVAGSGRPFDPSEEFAEALNATPISLERNGEELFSGLSSSEVDDHVESLRRLAAGLTAHGRALEPGQRVITGAFCRHEAAAGDRFAATYGGIGTVEVNFS